MIYLGHDNDIALFAVFLLARVFSNLFTNSIRYNKAGAEMKLPLTEEKGMAAALHYPLHQMRMQVYHSAWAVKLNS